MNVQKLLCAIFLIFAGLSCIVEAIDHSLDGVTRDSIRYAESNATIVKTAMLDYRSHLKPGVLVDKYFKCSQFYGYAAECLHKAGLGFDSVVGDNYKPVEENINIAMDQTNVCTKELSQAGVIELPDVINNATVKYVIAVQRAWGYISSYVGK